MKQVNNRYLLKNLKECLDSLPFEIVDGRTGKVIALVSPPSYFSKLQEQLRLANEMIKELQVDETPKNVKTTFGKCMNPFCKEEGELTEGESRGAWNDQMGEYEVLRGWFCPKHLTK